MTYLKKRRNFGNSTIKLPELDLSLVQRQSWQWFLKDGIKNELTDISPIEDFAGKNWELSFGNYALENPSISPKEAREKGITFSSPFKVQVTLTNKKTGNKVTQEVFFGNIPQMTSVGTFIINGIERTVINQIVRSPGVYFAGDLDAASGRMLYYAEVRPLHHGSWLEFEINKNDIISARIDRRRKVNAATILRALGIDSDEAILKLFEDADIDPNHRYIKKTIAKDPTKTREDALLEIYKKLRPGEPALIDNAETLFHNLFFDARHYDLGRVGRYKINKRLNLNIENTKQNWVLTKDDIVGTLHYLVGLQNGKGQIDDIDHLANRRLRCVGELVATHAFRGGLLRLERSIKEKMSLVSLEERPNPSQLINARPLIASLNEFFRSNQLSTILDNTNPLSEIDNLRRVSVLGPGGINRERASFSIRDVNPSQYGRIDPVRSPEGMNIGLVTYLTLYAKINEFGFIETPYRRVEKRKINNDEIVYLTADDEQKFHITHAGINIDKDNYIKDDRVAFRFNGSFTEGQSKLVDFIDLTPRQVFGASASLIPFLDHDEGNRALMGSNMQCQAVPLINPNSPVVGTGMESIIASSMKRVIRATHKAEVVYVDGDRIEVKLDKQIDESPDNDVEVADKGKKLIYHLTKFWRTAQSTCYNQKAKVNVGDKVKPGDLLVDGPSTDNGELALGQNMVVAYASIGGYGFEDAILVSDRLVKDDLLTSINIREYQADVVETKLGPESVTNDIPNVSELELANLSSDGIVVVGAEVHPNDILVGKIAPKGETELTPEERLLRAIFGEKAREVRDTSLRVPHGEEGIVIAVDILSKEKGDELAPGVIKSVIVKVAQLRKVTVGDKIAGRHGNKGVISKIMPAADMPYLPDGTPVDLVISPLSVLARMNLGQLLECHLGWALGAQGDKASVPVFDRIPEDTIRKELEKAGLPVTGKTRLVDGRTGEALGEDTVVGIGYIMKLKHMIEDKTHARSTGPYSLVTQQPLGGKAQMGGQRLGEMEVWALEAHRAAHTLQEMLTIKSDDIVGRAAAFGAIVKGEEIPLPKVPESFKVLVRELNALCLAIDVEGTQKALEGTIVKEKTVTDPLVKLRELDDLTGLRIRLASDSEIRSWSRGEIIKPETINYRTLKPEKDGLFDERIFGPTKDWECYCGKYKRIRYKGVICDKCGVEVTESRVRRERMGHISLAAPVVHVWYFKGAPSKVSLLLDLPPKALEQVIYFARYIVMSIDDEERKKAIKSLAEQREEKIKEAKEIYSERKELIKKEGEERKTKIEGRIKDKEQSNLAISEVDLDTRKKETTMAEEERVTLEKTEELFEKMTDLVKKVQTFGFLSEDEYDKLVSYGVSDFLEVKMGAEAVLGALESINLVELSKSLRQDLLDLHGKGARYLKVAKRLKLIDGLKEAKISASSVVLKVLPVLPPDLRPMVQLAGGRFATSDLNDLYRRVINRNNRLKHLIGLGAPDIILRNEKRMLQEAVDSLIDSSQRKAVRRGRGRLALRSLSDMLKGKQGRFRQNLLGKRVDYSGRSVIVVGPELKLNQCGLPKEMALEMFKPFVLREVIKRGIAPNVKSAKNLLERRPPEVFDILEEITKDHPVLLNRAPTLHKLGILAFYPVLIEGNAIRLHPAVCSGFNADFDGDQMAVHVPLGKMAIEEAKTLMMADKNLLRASDGSPVATPASKEMALGVYYFTSDDPRITPFGVNFADKEEAVFAYQIGKTKLRQKVKVRINGKLTETTTGRILFNEVLPFEGEFVNQSVNSFLIKELVTNAYSKFENDRVVELIDAIKNIGFLGGTISGLSFGVADAAILPGKEKIIKDADKKVIEIEKSFNEGLITNEEKKRSVQQIWIETTEEIADKTWEMIPADSPIRTVIDAKVGRTSRDQIKQLAGMRGLVVDPLGKIVELPVKSNFREGLSVFEYVASGRGSRKGLTDTALKTADAGYLTRRLVDVTHDVLVRVEDCGTKEGLVIKKSIRSQGFYKRIVGRFDLVSGEIIDEKRAKEIELDEKITQVIIRSPLACITRYGICQKCYGWDLSNKKVVEIGMPVGVIAAQSIGEQGTQLTLRTKHSGGIVGIDVTQGLPRVEELFETRMPKVLSPISEISGKASIKETDEGYAVKVTTVNIKPKEERQYLIAKTNKLAIADGELIDAGTQLASGYLDVKEILQIKGLVAAQEYLVNELQAVYESQGISINDRHFEVIVRKMSDEVKIATSGDTHFLPEELIDRSTFEEEVEKIIAAGGEAATARQIVLGVTKRALYTNSWLSSASFEQTTDVLGESALRGRRDKLRGLKENVIIGRLIPIDPKRVMI